MLCQDCRRPDMLWCGSCDEKQFDAFHGIKEYAINFPDYFREPFTTNYKATTAGKAKYQCYLSFSDAYSMTFSDFLKIIRVSVVA